MITRTWKYGHRLAVKILDVFPRPANPRCPGCVVVEDEAGEGHILMGGIVHEIEPKNGMEVEMRFTEGGSTGGFWKIVGELAPWFWTENEEAEHWQRAGSSRLSAILAAAETPISEAPRGVWFAPGRRVREEDLKDFEGSEEPMPEVGGWIVDEARIEHLTAEQLLLETVKR